MSRWKNKNAGPKGPASLFVLKHPSFQQVAALGKADVSG